MLPVLVTRKVEWDSEKTTRENMKELNRVIQLRATIYESGPEGERELWRQVLEEEEREMEAQQRTPKPPPSASAQKLSNHRRSAKAMDDGRISKSAKALQAVGVADSSQATFDTIKAKFPEASLPKIVENMPPAVQVTAVEVECAIHSFPRGSAGGLTGLKPQHLKDILRNLSENARKDFLSSLTRYSNRIIAFEVPPELGPYLSAAEVIPLIKINGDLRPVSVGETLRRLICKAALRVSIEPIVQELEHHQLGVGTKGGAEAIVHSVTNLMDKAIDNPDTICGLIDAMNAFNMCSRQAFLDEILLKFPGLYRLVAFLYGSASIMVMHSKIILCVNGVHQGCPLGAFLFSMTIQPLIAIIK